MEAIFRFWRTLSRSKAEQHAKIEFWGMYRMICVHKGNKNVQAIKESKLILKKWDIIGIRNIFHGRKTLLRLERNPCTAIDGSNYTTHFAAYQMLV